MKLKVGAVVKIKDLNDPLFDKHEFPSVNTEMQNYSNKLCVIQSASYDRGYCIYLYKLKEDNGNWNWSEYMFEIVHDFTIDL